MPNTTTVLTVLALEPIRIGGGESFARELSSQLGRHGWSSVLCFLSEPTPEVRRFLDLPNVSLETLPDSWRLHPKPIPRFVHLLRKYRPRVLHLHFTGFLGPFPWLARLQSVDRVFFTDQYSRPQNHVPARASFWKRALTRLVNAPLDRVICVSRYGYRCFTATDLLPRPRFEMIYNSVDLSRASQGLARGAEFRRRHAIPPERVVATQVSWMIPEKGVPDLLQAARLVVAQMPGAHWVLAGDGAHRQEYIRMATEFGIRDHVTFTGVVPDPLGEGLYAASDVVCQVSRWEEVFGYVIAEGMATGKPLLGTRTGGIPELIEHEKTGFLVERGDTAAMAERLLQLFRDPGLRERMGQAGLAAVQLKFDQSKNVAQLLRLYGLETS